MSGNGTLAPTAGLVPSWVVALLREWEGQGYSGQVILNYHRGQIGTVEVKRRIVANDVSV